MTCQVKDCDRRSVSKGLCRKHYATKRRNGDPNMLLDRGPGACRIEDCDYVGRRSLGMCPKHYTRMNRHGNPLYTKHDGHRKHPYFQTWRGMMTRCFSSGSSDYARYGGRGITVCPEWKQDFFAFADYLESALGPRPVRHTLDRIDNDGKYEPGNVRWADGRTQRMNQARVLPICSHCNGTGRVSPTPTKKGK